MQSTQLVAALYASLGDDCIYVPESGLALFFSPLANIVQTFVMPYRPGF